MLNRPNMTVRGSDVLMLGVIAEKLGFKYDLTVETSMGITTFKNGTIDGIIPKMMSRDLDLGLGQLVS